MNSRILLILSLVGIFFFSSCSKSALEDKLIGDWKQISVGQSELKKFDVVWTFAANRELYQTRTIDTTVLLIDTAQWSIEVNAFSKNSMTIENLNNETDGKHNIMQLDSYLELHRIELPNGHTEAFQWKEFEKK